MKRDILQNWHLYQISSLNTTKYCMSRSCYLPALFDIQLSSRQTWTLWTLYVMTDNNTANNVVLLYLSTLGNNIAYNWNNICSTRYYSFNTIRLMHKYHALFQRQLRTLTRLILEEYGETFVDCLIYKQTTTLCEIVERLICFIYSKNIPVTLTTLIYLEPWMLFCNRLYSIDVH